MTDRYEDDTQENMEEAFDEARPQDPGDCARCGVYGCQPFYRDVPETHGNDAGGVPAAAYMTSIHNLYTKGY